MSLIDIAILLVLGASVAYGFYRGAVSTLFGLTSGLLALALAFYFGPVLAAALGKNQGLTAMLATYTDAESKVGDYVLAMTGVSGLGESAVSAILNSADLPDCLAGILRNNLVQNAFASVGMTTVNQYVSNTIVAAVLQSVSFVLCFFCACLALHFAVNLVDQVFRFPVLKGFDGLVGGGLGLLRGMLLVYVLFLLAPIVLTVIPGDLLTPFVDESALYDVFASDGFFTRVVTGR